MDVPFSTSGAINRAHYALVRKVETAPSPGTADEALLHEVDAIRHALARPGMSLKHLKENLVLLMYCVTAANDTAAIPVDFAYHHAISLAEAGYTVQDKRIGYIFCSDIMAPAHELRLMLVNTLRKDLEAESVSRICLALETLTSLSSEDVLPAIRPRLIDLLSHNSATVRQKSLAACLKLAEHEPALLVDIYSKAAKRAGDGDPAVVRVALATCVELLKVHQISEDKFHRMLSSRIQSVWTSHPDDREDGILLALLSSLRHVTPSTDDILVITDILRKCSGRASQARVIIYQCFLVLEHCPSDALLSAQRTSGTLFVRHISHLLTSQDVLDVYTFIVCLECLDPALWAGTQAEVSSVLEAWEVERIMQLLDHADKSIRTKTLRVVHCVDPGLVEAHFAQLSQNMGRGQPRRTEERVSRLLEVIRVLVGADGASYVQHVKGSLSQTEGTTTVTKSLVLQGFVEEVLLDVRNGSEDFRSACIGALFASIAQPQGIIEPTLMVVLVALISEFLEMSPVSPMDLLRGLAERLPLYGASVQDACLLCMMRIFSACDEQPPEVETAIQCLREQAGRHIKRRCDQFLEFWATREHSRGVAAIAKSFALPDFLVALETYDLDKEKDQPRGPSKPSPQTSPRTSRSQKLRYEAYEAPRPVSRLRRLSNSSSRNSDEGTSKFVGQGRTLYTPLANALSPGNLTVMASRSDLSAANSPNLPREELPIVQLLDNSDMGIQADLIALESPFVSEPHVPIFSASSAAELDFQELWERYTSATSRGWSVAPIENVLGRIQDLPWHLRVTSADMAPFEGDLKVYISPDEPTSFEGHDFALLRLKESDDGSCLWQLRCADVEMQKRLQSILEQL